MQGYLGFATFFIKSVTLVGVLSFFFFPLNVYFYYSHW
jgi:hypothetical protein